MNLQIISNTINFKILEKYDKNVRQTKNNNINTKLTEVNLRISDKQSFT